MPELTLSNIDRITRDIRRQEIIYSHLFDDLVDHVCCDVENEMHSGLSFAEAYRIVMTKIGFRGLKKIQEDTLYEVDSKYRKMKNMMKITGVAGTVMLGFASVFKIMHWPGAGILLSLGALVTSFLFLPSALVVLWKETRSRKRIFLFVSAFISGVSLIFGILFKVQHWPGGGALITAFVVFTMLLFIPALLASRLKDEENKAKRPVYITGAIGGILYLVGFLFRVMHWPMTTLIMTISMILLFCLVFPWYIWVEWKDEPVVSARFIFTVLAPLLFIIPGALVNLNIEMSFEDGFFYRQEQQDLVARYQELRNEEITLNLKDSPFFSSVERVHEATENVIGEINKLEWRMVQVAEGEPGKPAEMGMSDGNYEKDIPYRALSRPFHTGPVREFLLPGCPARQELENSINSLNETIRRELGDEKTGSTGVIMNFSAFLPGQDEANKDIKLITGLHGLTLLKSSILGLESDVINRIAMK